MKSRYTATFLSDEGGSTGFYRLKESKTLGFKEFRSKRDANFAYKMQKKLSRLGLAPKVYGKVCKIKVDIEDSYYNESWSEPTGWGFLTQIVKTSQKVSLKKIQDLVDKIYKKTKLSFWDCHTYNIGMYKNRYLCIDTGRESFDRDCNAWGFASPGPKCNYCKRYTCNCNDY